MRPICLKGAPRAPFFVRAAFTLFASIGAAYAHSPSPENTVWPSADTQQPNQPRACLDGQNYEITSLKSVTDGDTIVLNDNRRVRIIGINTPELRNRQGKTEPYAHDAKMSLEQFLSESPNIRLITGVEQFDRHGRTLAHIERTDGKSVAEHLLEQGLAAHIVVSPNNRCSKTFAQIESQAKKAKQGLWEQPNAWRVRANQLRHKHTGFRLVHGRVINVKHNGLSHVISIDQGLRVRVSEALSKQLPLHALQDRRVEVRGWLSLRNGNLQVRLHDALNLRVLD